MIIIDHGNIWVDTIFMIVIMHSFPDIEENLFFDNGGPYLHTHNMHIVAVATSTSNTFPVALVNCDNLLF